ncbi:conjugal transfer protein TrbF [Herbaspirillum seropedicae]|uniref:conjugal transfer protein TrbF n=1 Tax=Herbaspirillum seropedicae TaxID=964 RepID=UPI0031D9ECD3
MNISERIKNLAVKKSHPIEKSDSENPYLATRRTWNEHVGSLVSQRQTWQVIGILSMLIALAGVGGVIHIGSQSRFVPYVIEVDKLGNTIAAGPVQSASKADPRVIHAALTDWMSCARMVSPDVAVQRNCVFKVYSMLAPSDAATAKMNEWLNGTAESNPFKRAETEMVSIEIKSAIPQTPDTWQVEWNEVTRDRQGTISGGPVVWRALVTTYIAEVLPGTTEEQLRNNPMSIYVRDFSWSRVR